jgi:hypothetical protein
MNTVSPPMKPLRILGLLALVTLAGCMPRYTLVPPGPTAVAKDALTVQPSSTWNRIPKTNQDIPWEESWTKNGPLLDTIAFVGGLPDGKALAQQKKKDDQQVPTFRENMSPDDLVSMVEGSYRVGGVRIFNVLGVEPVPFLGQTGLKMDFSYVTGDNLVRSGRCVLGVVGKQLYLLKLEGAADHYFTAALPEFDAMLASAALR